MHDRIESLIIHGLLTNQNFASRIVPFIRADHFSQKTESCVYEHIHKYISKYNNIPTKEAVLIHINQNEAVKPEVYEAIKDYLNDIDKIKQQNEEFLLQEAENFYKEQNVFLAVKETVNFYEDRKKKGNIGLAEICKNLMDAAGSSFNRSIGHDYLMEYKERYEQMHQKIDKIPFDLEMFNKITRGGVEKKTLNIVMAAINCGKSMFLTHLASSYLMYGKNVLFITLEMSKQKVANRIDANLLNIGMGDLDKLSFDVYERKSLDLRNKTIGRLVIEEYPTTTASILHFRHLINELHLKKNFKPDVIFIDYLNIAVSSRMKPGNSIGMYQYYQSIAHEFRGLAIEFDVPLWTATQLNRTGFKSSDPNMADTAESMGVPAAADFIISLSRNEDLDEMNQVSVKQLKSRYGDPSYYTRFVIGVDRPKMKFYDVENSAETINGGSLAHKEDSPVFDKSVFGSGVSKEKRDFSTLRFDDDEEGPI